MQFPYYLEAIDFLASPEFQYTSLAFILFVFPRFLVRLGIPFALSAFVLGMIASSVGWDLGNTESVKLLATLGIISLFLFAGLEVEFDELRKTRKILIQHVAIRVFLVTVSTFVISVIFELDIRPATLFALAVLTPSTGFILDTLDMPGVPSESKFWIRSKAIAAEIVALLLMFTIVQSSSIATLVPSFFGLGLLVAVLPFIFRFFVRVVEPVAPKSEFGFLVMLALLAGMVTKRLGAYYLIGAFIVGVIARRFEPSLPSLTSSSMLKSVKSFSGFFVPFYFFTAGSSITSDELSLHAVALGLLTLIVFIPIRIKSVVAHRRVVLDESPDEGKRVATLLLPNLVFGLVLADILQNQFAVPPHIVGALIIYTIGATVAPPILLRFLWRNQAKAPYVVAMENKLSEASWGDVDPRNPL